MEALILMTRIPIAGQTKTRLMDVLTAKECEMLHMAFLKDLFRVLQCLKKKVDIYIYFTPNDKLYILDDILDLEFNTLTQEGESLGDKMIFGFEILFKKNYKKVILIGSDIPDIQSNDILTSFEKLIHSDIVIGPTLDGGYYLIGMKAQNPEIFQGDILWGKQSVFDATVERATSKGLKISYAKKMLDIDTKEDLKVFYHKIQDFNRELISPPIETIHYIKELWGTKSCLKIN